MTWLRNIIGLAGLVLIGHGLWNWSHIVAEIVMGFILLIMAIIGIERERAGRITDDIEQPS